VVSCGQQRRGKKTTKADFVSAIEPGGAPLTSDEIATALRICYAFRSKRTKFRTDMKNFEFRFRFEEENCEKESRAEEARASLRLGSHSDPIEWDINTKADYLPLVQTDVHGFISAICESVVRGETPTNTTQSGVDLMEVSFKAGSLKDSYTVRMGTKEELEDEEFKVYRVATFEVLTNATSAGNFLGLVVSTELAERCESPGRYSQLTQTYLD
jgi:hypothetical protein